MRARLGLAQHLVPRDPRELTPERAAHLAALGLRAIVTHFTAVTPRQLVSDGHAQRVRAALAAEGIAIVQATAYNPLLVAVDDDHRAAELERLRDALSAASGLGAEMLITGCGSLHETRFYGPHPGNHAPATRARLVDSLRRIAPYAEQAGVPVALESHVLTTLDSPEAVRELLDAVDSPWVTANFDPINFIGSLPELYDNAAVIRRTIDVLGPRLAPCAHVKDVVAVPDLQLHIDEVPPGEGLLDFDAFFAACRTLGEDVALVVEHLDDERAERALAFVRERAPAAGITLR